MATKKRKRSYWNFRVVTNICSFSGERLFSIREVHYSQYGRPQGYGEKGLMTDHTSMKDLKWVAKKVKLAFKKPILDADNWPNKWKNPDK